MLGNSVPVENMSHLADSFPLRDGGDLSNVHATQQTKRRIKLTLLFVIPASDESMLGTLLEDQRPEDLPRFASVRVPQGVPVARLRPLIRHVEEALQDIFGKCKRANFVMMCDEDADSWTFSFDLPTFGVVYV
jgi:hypothetical protein